MVGSDHAGLPLKEALKGFLAELGYEVHDVGTHTAESVDYPDYAGKAAGLVSEGQFPRGILFCGTGLGTAIAANKVPGIRAVVCGDIFTAELSRSHNDANILVLGGWVVGEKLAQEIVRVWLQTPFAGGRHQRRLDKIAALERQARLRRGQVYDVSLSIYPGMPVYPGSPELGLESVRPPGRVPRLSLLHIGTHTGSHVDAPCHFLEGGEGVDLLPAQALTGPARLFRVDSVRAIDGGVVAGLDLEGVSRALFATANSPRLREGGPPESWVYISESGARALMERGVKLVGLDSLSMEEWRKPGAPAHNLLLRAGVVVVEGLDFSGVPPGDYELLCLPLKVRAGDGAPARVFLREV